MHNKIMKAFAKMLESTMNPMPNHCVECNKPTQETLCSECIDRECDELKENEDPLSVCCSAPFTYPGWPDSDFCSECHEHASAWEDEDEGDD